MKKNVILLGAMMISSFAWAQIGINTATPTSTLDVTAKNATGKSTNVDGLLVPRVDRERAQSMTGVPTSTLIYINDVSTGTQATGTTTINVDTVGYYYFEGAPTNAWVKLKTPAATPTASVNIYNANGTLTGNRTVNQGTNWLAFNTDIVNGFAVSKPNVGYILSVDGNNSRVGIGTTTPAAKLDVAGTIKIADGTQAANRVLTSDANGLASWQTPAAAPASVNLYNTDGTLTGNRVVTQGANTLTLNTTAVNGFAVSKPNVGYILSVDGNNSRVGIGTTAPSNKLHVIATADPIKLEGLQASNNTTLGALTTDANGVVKVRNSNTISAVKVTGSLTIATNNVNTFIDTSSTPTEQFDNLNEFSGNSFTAIRSGLYNVSYTVNFNQTNSNYEAAVYILGTSSGTTGSSGYIPANLAVSMPIGIGVTKNELLKLTAGQTISFSAATYAAANGQTATYTVIIQRVD